MPRKPIVHMQDDHCPETLCGVNITARTRLASKWESLSATCPECLAEHAALTEVPGLYMRRQKGVEFIATFASANPDTNAVYAYLRWLAASKYDYHLDDAPEDIETFSPRAKMLLRRNADALWGWVNDEGSRYDAMWHVYAAALRAAGKMEAEEAAPAPKAPAGYIVAYTTTGKRGNVTSDWDVFTTDEYETPEAALAAAREAYDDLRALDSTYSVSLTQILASSDYF